VTSSPLRNPFYVVALIVGVAFAIHATAYALWYAGIFDSSAQAAPHPLIVWLERHGDRFFLIELAILAVATVAAMATENWWRR